LKDGKGLLFASILTDAGIILGIKVDCGAEDLAGHPGEKITEGLDKLRERLAEYFQMGAANPPPNGKFNSFDWLGKQKNLTTMRTGGSITNWIPLRVCKDQQEGYMHSFVHFAPQLAGDYAAGNTSCKIP